MVLIKNKKKYQILLSRALLKQACQVSKMDWSVIICGARLSAARDRPSEAREFAREVRGHAPSENFENLGAISCILRLWKPYFIPFT